MERRALRRAATPAVLSALERERLIRHGTRWFPLLVGLVGFSAYAWIFGTGLVATPVRSDGYSYYVYLPSWVIYHDPSLEAYSHGCCNGEFPAWSGLRRWEGTNRWVNPHPMGVAVLALPLFVGARALSAVVPVSYRHAAALAGVVYLVAGLYVLRRLLLRHFTDAAVLATLVAVTFGTNLFHYATYESLWSHVYSFFLFACLLSLVDTWSEAPALGRSLLLGTVVGAIFLVRHANLLGAAIVPLFGVVDWASLRARVRFLWAHVGLLLLAAAVATAVALPQLLMYRDATGSLFPDVYAYLMRGSGVQLWHPAGPHLAGILFTLPKGLLFWSPVLVLAVVGVFLMRGRVAGFVLPCVAYLSVSTYLIASWWDWQLGASFGNRGFTDSLALFAIPMAAAYQRFFQRPHLAVAARVFTGLAVVLSLVQMYQYWVGILPYMDITWTQYQGLFLRLHR